LPGQTPSPHCNTRAAPNPPYHGGTVYTFGIDPQIDRGLLCDFLEAINTWAATYTVDICTLSAERIHALTTNPILTSIVPPLHLTPLVAEKDMLPALITAYISRFIFTRTIDEHALSFSSHAHAPLIEALAHE
jgi:hypothetical protein